MKYEISILFLIFLFSLSSCNKDATLNNLNNFNNRVTYLQNNNDFNNFVNGGVSYYNYNLTSYLKENDDIEILTINGNFEVHLTSLEIKDKTHFNYLNGEIIFNLIENNISLNEYKSLTLKLYISNSLYFDIKYEDSSKSFEGLYFVPQRSFISFDFNTYLFDVNEFINDYYGLYQNEDSLIESKVAFDEVSSNEVDINNINISNNTYFSIYRDVKDFDRLLNEGKIKESIFYFDMYPNVPILENGYKFKNGQLKNLFRCSKFNNDQIIFIFNESLYANQETFYNLILPSNENYLTISDNKINYFTNINLGYKTNLREFLSYF